MSKKVTVDAEALKLLLDAVDAKGPALELGIVLMNRWRRREFGFIGEHNPIDILRLALDGPTAGHCVEGENHCVCGGDLPRVREGCHNWRKA